MRVDTQIVKFITNPVRISTEHIKCTIKINVRSLVIVSLVQIKCIN